MRIGTNPVLPVEERQFSLEIGIDGITTLTSHLADRLNAWSLEATRQLGVAAESLRFEALSASVDFVSDDMPAGSAAMAKRQPITLGGK